MDAAEGGRFKRYSAGAMALHWMIAALIVWQLVIGFGLGAALNTEDPAARFAAFEAVQLHKSVGLTVLFLSVLRLVWRLAVPPPRPITRLPPVERLAGGLAHAALYALTIALPLTGWAMASSSPTFRDLPIVWFGVVALPSMPLLDDLAEPALSIWSGRFATAHWLLAYVAIMVAALHAAAAIRHHLLLRDQVLARMVPGLPPLGVASEPMVEKPSVLRRAAAALLLLGAIGGVAALVIGYEPGETADDHPAVVDVAPEIASWRVIAAESEIGFSGKHSGAPFHGGFSDWTAEIEFDPDRLDRSGAVVAIRTASASTGDMIYDGTLPSADWFDAAAHPQALFETTSIRAGATAGAYVAEGRLTIKGVSRLVELPFELHVDGDRAEMRAHISLPRLEYGLGVAADPTGAWVSLEIPIEIHVVAERARRGLP